MYIHNYQIHNVLNAYRKQLSQSPAKANAGRPAQTASLNEVPHRNDSQQPAIVNRISTEIIDRITQFGPQSEFENTVANQMAAPQSDIGEQNDVDFTYTVIDEQNRKTTQTMQMQFLNARKYDDASQGQTLANPVKDEAQSKETLNNNPKTPNVWKG